MDMTIVVLVLCMVLAGIILGMIIMGILLHPYRKALKRTGEDVRRLRGRERARQRLQSQLSDLDRER